MAIPGTLTDLDIVVDIYAFINYDMIGSDHVSEQILIFWPFGTNFILGIPSRMHWCITENMSSKSGEKVKIFISISKYPKMIIWYPNDILLKSIIFSKHTGNHSKYRSYFIFCHML